MGTPPQVFIPYEDRPECPTCGLKLAYMPPGWWTCLLFHGPVWRQRLKAWWRGTPIVMDRDLGLRLVTARFGKPKTS